ncbi:MAG: transglycosylase [Denitrovibrio sp.]|nr:MAG: transglycosylase [Denitrovibrio sp.]
MDGCSMIRLIVVICILLSFSVSYADDFEDFKSQNQGAFEASKQEFTGYKKDINKSFEMYKNILDEEFSAYKSEISKKWDDTEVSTNTKWVEYLNNYKIRKIVDFDKQEIRIDVIGGSKEGLKPVLNDLLKEDKGDAFRRDPVAFNTEKRLREQVPDALTDKIHDESIVSSLYSDNKLTNDDISALSDKILKQSVTGQGTSIKTGKPYVTMTVKLPQDSYQKSAKKITKYVDEYSDEYKLDPALIMSVIYNESRFNPLAKSYVPAYGLMQIVPKSAGVDAISFIEGKKRILAPSYLYNAGNNVKIGSAYLHIVYYRYFKGIKNLESRLYCSIAAYNTGAGNVAYAFNKNNGGRYSISKALPVINSMSPDDVYRHLRDNLRFAEARKYIVNVYNKMKDY